MARMIECPLENRVIQLQFHCPGSKAKLRDMGITDDDYKRAKC